MSKQAFYMHTGQIGKQEGVDITVKSGEGIWRSFAPTWNMVMAIKYEKMDMIQYTEQYFALLDKISEAVWTEVFSKEDITFLCYCGYETFCHRNLIPYYVLFVYYKKQDQDHPIVKALNKLNKEPYWYDGDKRYNELERKIFNRLECSSVGDKRFSAFFAVITLGKERNTIEHFYQTSKRFNSEIPKTWKDAKGRKPTHFNFGGKDFPVEALTQFYNWLWLRYLDENKTLVNFASYFDSFTDRFRGKSINCQAVSIEIYVKKGRIALINLIEPYYEQFEELIKG